MKDLKRAFGSPDPEFTDRVRQTLFRIEEKEEEPVKKKLTFSMAMAMILCVCIVSVSAFAGTALITAKPDVTRSPLSQSENSNPGSTPDPEDFLPILSDVYWPEDAGNIFHWDETCKNMSYPCTVMSFSSALEAGGQLCPLCFGEFSGFATLPALTDSPTSGFVTLPALTENLTSVHVIPVPTPTPIPAEATLIPFQTPQPTADTDPVFVWSAPGDTSYHANPLCTKAKEGTARVSLAVAENRRQTACSSCGPLYYSYYELIRDVYLPENSDIFHRTTDCTEMSLPCTVPTLIDALKAGAQPCPLCMSTADPESAVDSPATATPVPDMVTQLPYATALPGGFTGYTSAPLRAGTDNPLVYVSQDLTTFHYVSSLACTDNAGMLTPMSLTDALNEGALPCHECRTCWVGEDSELCHMSETCSRLNSAELQLFSALPDDYQYCGLCVRFYDLNNNLYHRFAWCSEFGDDGNAHAYIPCSLNFPALIGSTPCKLCVPESDPALLQTPMLTAEPTPTPMPTAEPLPISGTVCLSSSDDRFFHRTFICGLTAADSSMSLLDALNAGYAPCPDCYGEDAVYIVNGGDSYHTSDKTCFLFLASSSSFADVSLTEALLRGKMPCEECVLKRNETEEPFFYYTPDDWFCHSDLSCFGEDEIAIGSETEEKLIAMGKRACETCMEPFSYYYTDENAYYHSSADCENADAVMTEQLPEDQLIELGKRSCPWCLSWYARYYSHDDRYYHEKSGCEAFIGAETDKKHADEKTLLEMGWLPCGKCFGSIASDPTAEPMQVFSTPNGTFYHTVPDCSGMKNAELVVLAEALNRSQTACPFCAEKNAPVDSSIVFLWDPEAPVYHAVYDCSGYEYLHQMELTDAAAQNLTPCPECLNTEDTVWYTQDSEFYHSCLHYAYLNLPDVIERSPIDALADGKRPCETCMLTETAKGDATLGSVPPRWSTGDGHIFFYDYSQGHADALHFSADCEKMRSPVAVSLETAVKYELWHCDLCSDAYFRSDCIVERDDTVYHLSDTCREFVSADLLTRWDVLLLGLEPCPDCAWEQENRTGPIPTVPPQPTMPPAGDQASLKRWLLSEEEQQQCLTDLGYSKQ